MSRSISLFLLVACGCGDVPVEPGPAVEPVQPLPVAFGARQDLGSVGAAGLVEASGLVMSRQNRGVLWSHNDSGDTARLFALGPDGADLGTYTLDVNAYDWEDLAIGPGPIAGQHYLYVGDIGDNFEESQYIAVARVPEPLVSFDQTPLARTLGGTVELRFVYPGGARDAEALMIDPTSADIYIVTKDHAEVYRAAAPHATSGTVTLELVQDLSLSNVTGADISPAGDELLIKTYDHIVHWSVPATLTVAEALTLPSTTLPYVVEPQGEAVGWASDRMGYLTVSEGARAHLYFYPRLLSE